MKTKLVLVLLAFFMVFCSASVASAATIFMNFDPPNFTADTGSGADTSHVYNTSYGTITFNGRIFNEFSHVVKPDHTTGSGNFLKNTGGPSGQDKITMIFSFDVANFDVWLLGLNGVEFHGAAYDINGDLIDGAETWAGNGNWF